MKINYTRWRVKTGLRVVHHRSSISQGSVETCLRCGGMIGWPYCTLSLL